MKILIAQPIYDPSFAMPSIALAYLTESLQKIGFNIQVIDFNLLGDKSLEQMVNISLANNPDIIALTCWGNMLPFCIEFSKELKKRNNEIKIVIGGMMATLLHLDILRESPIDIVVRGEGEVTLPQLATHLQHNLPLKEIRGITYKENGKIIQNDDQPLIKNLDILPSLSFDSISNLGDYIYYSKYKTLPYQASRGCPFSCIFCSIGKMWGMQRKKSPQRIVNEIEYLKKNLGIHRLCLCDDIFTLSSEWVSTICKLLIAKKLDIEWSCLTRIDLVNKPLLEIMHEAGCRNIFYGIESASPRILNFIGRQYTPIIARKNIQKTANAKITSSISIIYGFPIERESDIIKTMKFVSDVAQYIDELHTHVLFPLPGTDILERYGEYIIKNPYPKMSQPGLARLPPKFFELLLKHEKYVPDFWMFKSNFVTAKRVLQLNAKTKLQFINLSYHNNLLGKQI